MIKTRFIFAVSFCAMIAAGAVHADTATTGIAGVSYVDRAVGTATTAANNAQTSANNANAAAGNAQTSADNAQDAADAAQKSADEAAASAAAANTAVAKKQDKSTAAYQMGNASGGWTAMTTAQQNALNSGVTSSTVSQVATNKTNIANKEDSANKIDTLDGFTGDKSVAFPTVDLTETLISTANTNVMDSVNLKQDASTAVKVSKSGTAVGSATVPVYVNASGVATAITSYSGNAATATKATQDGNGKVIADTYATKSELTSGLAAKQGTLKAGSNITIADDGTISATDTNTQVTVDSALSASSTNPVQNKVVYSALSGKQASLGYTAENSANKVTSVSSSSTDTQYPSAKAMYTALSGKLSTSGTAAKATADASGNVITSTYATKTELTNGLAGKQDKMLATEITTAVSDAKDSYYPSVGLMETSIATANNNVMDSVNAKLASVSSTGTGTVVKAVAKDGTAVKATLGYIGSSDITDGGVALADLAPNSVNSAKIVDASIATADIAAGAVTAAKTSGVIGSIPSGSATSTTYATIWVE